MRKIIYFIFVFAFSMLIIAGCSSSQSEVEDAPQNIEEVSDYEVPKVYASFYPIWDFAQRIGGERIDLELIIPAGADPHHFEISARGLADMENADLILLNGLEFEPWENDLRSIAQGNVISLGEYARPLPFGDDHHNHGHDHDHNHDHDHDHDSEFASRPVDEGALADPGSPGVPAIVVKPKSIADAYNLRQQYRAETTVAVFPGEVLTRLYGTLGDARQVLSAVAAGAQSLVAAALLMVIAVHVLQRRRQIGALRAFGAPRAVVLAMVWLEVFLILVAGLLAGFGIGYAAVRVLSERLGEASGVAMPVEFQPSDAWTLALFLCVAAVVTLLPALIAYRQTPAQALRA